MSLAVWWMDGVDGVSPNGEGVSCTDSESQETSLRKRARPACRPQVPITSELGCVTPWLVVPGPWSDKEITHHARALAEGGWVGGWARSRCCLTAAPSRLPQVDGDMPSPPLYHVPAPPLPSP